MGRASGQQSLTGKLKENVSFQEELKKTIDKILEYKTQAEANIVGSFWKDPSTLFDYDEIATLDFDNNQWRVLYEIIYKIVIEEDKKSVDDVTVGFYLEKHSGLKEVYTNCGGFDAIQKVMDFVKLENLQSYINDFNKWKKVKELAMLGYPVNNRLSDFNDKSIGQIYDEFEVTLNSIFSGADFGIKSYDISDGIYDLIDRLDKGLGVGMPFKDLEMVNSETGGMMLGDVTLIGGVSNSGKSTFLRLAVLPTVFEKGERVVIFLNEEGMDRWQTELMIWVANRIYAQNIQKWQVKRPNHTPEIAEILKKSAQWLEKSKKDKNLTLIPLPKYKTSTVIKLIKKYSSMGVNNFIIDTFKLDNADSYQVDNNARLQMVQNMTALYNTIKDSNKNVRLICTVQLSKGSSRMRYLALDNIGESKNIVDVCANAFFVRNIFEDEYSGGKRALRVKRYAGLNDASIVPVTLDKDKKYQILFVAKSRDAAAGVGSKQIVLEVDFSRNIMKEVGFTEVPVDF